MRGLLPRPGPSHHVGDGRIRLPQGPIASRVSVGTAADKCAPAASVAASAFPKSRAKKRLRWNHKNGGPFHQNGESPAWPFGPHRQRRPRTGDLRVSDAIMSGRILAQLSSALIHRRLEHAPTHYPNAATPSGHGVARESRQAHDRIFFTDYRLCVLCSERQIPPPRKQSHWFAGHWGAAIVDWPTRRHRAQSRADPFSKTVPFRIRVMRSPFGALWARRTAIQQRKCDARGLAFCRGPPGRPTFCRKRARPSR